MRIRHTVTALTFALATAGIAQAAPVAVVNGTAIQQNELDSAVSAIVRSGGGRIKDTPELRNEVKQQLINRQSSCRKAPVVVSTRLRSSRNAWMPCVTIFCSRP